MNASKSFPTLNQAFQASAPRCNLILSQTIWNADRSNMVSDQVRPQYAKTVPQTTKQVTFGRCFLQWYGLGDNVVQQHMAMHHQLKALVFQPLAELHITMEAV